MCICCIVCCYVYVKCCCVCEVLLCMCHPVLMHCRCHCVHVLLCTRMCHPVLMHCRCHCVHVLLCTCIAAIHMYIYLQGRCKSLPWVRRKDMSLYWDVTYVYVPSIALCTLLVHVWVNSSSITCPALPKLYPGVPISVLVSRPAWLPPPPLSHTHTCTHASHKAHNQN